MRAKYTVLLPAPQPQRRSRVRTAAQRAAPPEARQ